MEVKIMEDNKTPDRTFTQEEVNKMIASRVNDLNSKYADYEALKEKALKFDEAEEANKTELQKAQEQVVALQATIDANNKANAIREMKSKVSTEMGVPADILTADDEEGMKAQAEMFNNALNAALEAKIPNYPKIKDGGEPGKVSSTTVSEQFAEWFANR